MQERTSLNINWYNIMFVAWYATIKVLKQHASVFHIVLMKKLVFII